MKRFLKLHHGEKGFTLLELLIVVVILGILAAILVPNLVSFLGTGNVAAANTEVANIESSALAYYADYDGVWPATSTVLSTEGYISALPKYAVYSFDAVPNYGKVGTVAPTDAANDAGIVWDGVDHKWEKA